MKLMGQARFQGSEPRLAGFGAGAELCWWLATEPDGAWRVHVARLHGASLAPIGAIPVTGRPDAICVSLDGAWLLVLAGPRLHALPLARPGAAVESHPLPRDAGATAIASPDGRTVYIAWSIHLPPLWRLDRATGEIDRMAQTRSGVSTHHPLLALSPDGRLLAFGHVFDSIEVFDLERGGSALWPRHAATLPDLEVRTSSMLAFLGFSEDGALLVSLSDPRRPAPDRPPVLRIGDAAGSSVAERPFPGRMPWLSVAGGAGAAAAVPSDAPQRVDLVDPEGGGTLESHEVGHRVLAVRFNPAGDRLAVAHAAGVSVFSGQAPR